MTAQEVDNPVVATPDLIPGKQSPLCPFADYWGLLRRFTPRNDGFWGFWRVRPLWLPLLMGVCLFFVGCAGMEGERSSKLPGVTLDTGTLQDQEKIWRGMVLGGAFSPPVKGRLSDISRQAAEDAVRKRRCIVYLTTDGYQRLEIQTLGEDEKAGCHLLRERAYQDGTLVREEVKRVCE